MKNEFKRWIVLSSLFFLTFLFVCGGSSALNSGGNAPYYVKTGGNDSLDGLSDATAWATIAKVQTTVTSGDTVYFRSQDTWTASSGLSVLTATAGVTYDGATYGSGTRATLSSAGTTKSVVEIDVSNVTFKGFEVNGNNSAGCGGIYVGENAAASFFNVTIDNCIVHDIGTGSDWVRGIYIGSLVYYGPVTVSNVTLKNCTVYNTLRSGIAVYPTWIRTGSKVDTVLIRNCVAYNTGLLKGWGYGVDIKDDVANATVEYCYLHDNDYGFNLETYANELIGTPHNMVIRYNIIKDSRVNGINLANNGNRTYDGVIYGNLILNSGVGGAGVDISIGSANYGTSVFSFYNNTIYSTVSYPTGAVSVAGSSPFITGTPTFNFKNNIIYTTSRPALSECWNDDSNACTGNFLTHTNNLLYRSSGATDNHIILYKYGSSETHYNRPGVLTWEPTAKNTDPTFTGGTLPTGFTGTYGTDMVPNTNYFVITSGDAIDNGTTLGSPYNGCINGAGKATPILRPQGGAYDIGAYEYVK